MALGFGEGQAAGGARAWVGSRRRWPGTGCTEILKKPATTKPTVGAMAVAEAIDGVWTSWQMEQVPDAWVR